MGWTEYSSVQLIADQIDGWMCLQIVGSWNEYSGMEYSKCSDLDYSKYGEHSEHSEHSDHSEHSKHSKHSKHSDTV